MMEEMVKYLVLPSSVITIGALASGILMCVRSMRRFSAPLGLWTVMLYVIFGAGPVSFLLLGHLEYQFPPATTVERKEVNTIVVLAGHAERNPDYPLSSSINSATAYRLLEVISLFQLAPNSTVLISGTGEVATIMRDVLVSSGIPPCQIWADSDSLSTVESAANLAPIIGSHPFLLVTSAGHMPRAVGVFRKAGTTPLSVPTHYLTKRNSLAVQYFPSPVNLQYSDLAVSEYAALIWYRVNGWI